MTKTEEEDWEEGVGEVLRIILPIRIKEIFGIWKRRSETKRHSSKEGEPERRRPGGRISRADIEQRTNFGQFITIFQFVLNCKILLPWMMLITKILFRTHFYKKESEFVLPVERSIGQRTEMGRIESGRVNMDWKCNFWGPQIGDDATHRIIIQRDADRRSVDKNDLIIASIWQIIARSCW